MLDDGDIKIEGSIERYRKYVSFTDKLVITASKDQEERLDDFMDNFLKKNPKFKSTADKCDRGINYVKIKRHNKMEILEVVQELEKNKIPYSILEHNLTDIVYGKFSRSICDGFKLIRLDHIDIPKLSLISKIWRPFLGMGYLEVKKRSVYKMENLFKFFFVMFLVFFSYLFDIEMRDDKGQWDFVMLLLRKVVVFRLVVFSWFIDDVNKEYTEGQR